MEKGRAAPEARWALVAPERLESWLTRFRSEHGDARFRVAAANTIVAEAPDGVQAELRAPFPPVPEGDPNVVLVQHVLAIRTVGVLLVRRGGFAAGVFEGTRLITSKVGSRPLHGRSSAGGWSQQRFARRREGQVRAALTAAADLAARVLVPAEDGLDAVIVGGDGAALRLVLDDRRLGRLAQMVTEPRLDVPEPRLRVLEDSPRLFRATRVRVRFPAAPVGSVPPPTPPR